MLLWGDLMQHKHYPKLGGDLTSGCRRLAEGLGAVGVVAILYRGQSEQAEVGMTFAPGLQIDAAAFHKLTDEILKNTYALSTATPNRGCVMLAEATGAECVILFIIEKDGAMLVSVSQPKSNEFVAAFALGIANSYNAEN